MRRLSPILELVEPMSISDTVADRFPHIYENLAMYKRRCICRVFGWGNGGAHSVRGVINKDSASRTIPTRPIDSPIIVAVKALKSEE